MKIKTGIAIPMMAATSALVDEAKRMAEQKTTVSAQSDVDVPSSPKLSQPSRPECTQTHASSGERGSK
jgi:hypothetical protein